MRTLWWLSLGLFVTSAATMLVVRSKGYTSIDVEDGRYYLSFRSQRVETSRAEYERAKWRDTVSGWATATLFATLFTFIGLESLRFKSRPRR